MPAMQNSGQYRFGMLSLVLVFEGEKSINKY